MRSVCIAALMIVILGAAGTAQSQQPQGKTIPIFIFDARIRSFAPGIEALISLSDEQKKMLATAYSEAFGTPAVRLANSILQDSSVSVAQRQLATTTVLQAQGIFRTKSRAIFTAKQCELIDQVYDAFGRIFKKAQDDVSMQIKDDFNRDLGKLLTPEQKQAVDNKAAEVAAAQDKPAATDQPSTPPK